MFDHPGIDTTTDVAWITRDQFVYYLEMTHALPDPTDWPTFRDSSAPSRAGFGLNRDVTLGGPDVARETASDVPQFHAAKYDHWRGERYELTGVKLLRHSFRNRRVQPHSPRRLGGGVEGS